MRDDELMISDDAKAAWRLRAWDDETLQQAFVRESIVAISADEIGDVTDEPTKAEFRARLRSVPALTDRSDLAIGQFVGYWMRFRSRMAIGDVVVVPLLGARAAIGVVAGDYRYRPREPTPRLRHVRDVEWRVTDLPRRALDADLVKVVNAPGTICAFRPPDAVARLLRSAG